MNNTNISTLWPSFKVGVCLSVYIKTRVCCACLTTFSVDVLLTSLTLHFSAMLAELHVIHKRLNAISREISIDS